MKTYTQFLQEAKVPPAIAEKFGNILFGDARQKGESDTTYEKFRFEELQQFLAHDYGKRLSKDAVNTFKELLKLKKQFPEILVPKYKYVYRGIPVHKDKHPKRMQKIGKMMLPWLNDMQLDGLKQVKGQLSTQDWVQAPQQITYTPTNEVQSWTTEFSVGEGYAGANAERQTHELFYCLLRAKPPKSEMLFNTDFTNLVFDTIDVKKDVLAKEHEIIRVSKKPIKCDVFLENYYSLSWKFEDWVMLSPGWTRR